MQSKSRRGTVPEHLVVDKKQKFNWTIFIDEKKTTFVDISYSFQSESSKSKVVLRVADQNLSHHVFNTGKTVGEPKQNWIIDNFKCTSLGEINFPEQGIYTVELDIMPAKKEEIQFQWLWIK